MSAQPGRGGLLGHDLTGVPPEEVRFGVVLNGGGRLLRAGIDKGHVNRIGYQAVHEAVWFGADAADEVATVQVLVAGGVDLGPPSVTRMPWLSRFVTGRGSRRVTRRGARRCCWRPRGTTSRRRGCWWPWG